jgi:transposase
LTGHRSVLNTHASKAMAEVVAARSWLTVYRLPPYAHELNPVERVWAQGRVKVPEVVV